MHLRGRPAAAAGRAGQRLLLDDGHRRSRDQVPQGARREARRTSRSSLTLPSLSPHFPLQAPQEDIARYRGKYDRGWEAMRGERWQRHAGAGTRQWPACRPSSAKSGRPMSFPDAYQAARAGRGQPPLPWDELTAEQQAFQATKMAIHAAMVDRMDREIGRVRRSNSRDERAGQHADPVPFRQRRQCRDHGPRRRARSVAAARLGRRRTCASGRAGPPCRNTPFRMHKTWVHEGGISTPLIVHWPRGHRRPRRTAAQPGPRDRPRADDPGSRRRQAARIVQRPAGAAAARQEPGAGFRQGQRRRARLPVVVARRQPGDSRRRLEAGGRCAFDARPR